MEPMENHESECAHAFENKLPNMVKHCLTLLWGNFAGHAKSRKRAFRTRHRGIKRQLSNASVAYEASSISHASKSPRQAFRAKFPPQVKREAGESHQVALPSSFATPAPQSHSHGHTNPNARRRSPSNVATSRNSISTPPT